MPSYNAKVNDLLNQMVQISTNLKVHWDETDQWWSDELHDRFKRTYINKIQDTITLCLQGYVRQERVYGAGMREILKFVDRALGDIKKLKTLERLPDGTQRGKTNHYISQKEGYKRKYDDRAERDKRINYDNYRKQ